MLWYFSNVVKDKGVNLIIKEADLCASCLTIGVTAEAEAAAAARYRCRQTPLLFAGDVFRVSFHPFEYLVERERNRQSEENIDSLQISAIVCWLAFSAIHFYGPFAHFVMCRLPHHTPSQFDIDSASALSRQNKYRMSISYRHIVRCFCFVAQFCHHIFTTMRLSYIYIFIII